MFEQLCIQYKYLHTSEEFYLLKVLQFLRLLSLIVMNDNGEMFHIRVFLFIVKSIRVLQRRGLTLILLWKNQCSS